jgi:hypothetical protein
MTDGTIPDRGQIVLLGDETGRMAWLWREPTTGRDGRQSWSGDIYLLVGDLSADPDRPAGMIRWSALDGPTPEWAVPGTLAAMGFDIERSIPEQPTPAPGIDLRAELRAARIDTLEVIDGVAVTVKREITTRRH